MRGLLAKIADYIRETDKVFLSLCLFTTCFGCLSVMSATRSTGGMGDFIVQTAAMFLGLFVAVIASLFDFKTFFKFYYVIALLGLIPVLLTFFIGFGPAGTDDKAWLDLGIITFQPSELFKVTFIIVFSYHISKVRKNINKLKYLLPLCVHGGTAVVLIHLQGDDGNALVFAIMIICMLFVAGVNKKYFIIAFFAVVVAAPIIYFFIMNPDQQMRIQTMFDIEGDIQGAGWQQYCGRQALANGSFFGQGFLKGTLTQKGAAGIPEGHNDFIFVTIGEEWGFVGALVVCILLCAICIRCLYVAKNTADMGGKLICVGFFGWLFAQTVINVGMCLSLLPVIGVTLPFFSAGGTSLSCLYLGVGMVLSVYMHRKSRVIHLRDDSF